MSEINQAPPAKERENTLNTTSSLPLIITGNSTNQKSEHFYLTPIEYSIAATRTQKMLKDFVDDWANGKIEDTDMWQGICVNDNPEHEMYKAVWDVQFSLDEKDDDSELYTFSASAYPLINKPDKEGYDQYDTTHCVYQYSIVATPEINQKINEYFLQFADDENKVPFIDDNYFTLNPVYTLRELAEFILKLPPEIQDKPAELYHDDRLFYVDLPMVGFKGSQNQPVMIGERYVHATENELSVCGLLPSDVQNK